MKIQCNGCDAAEANVLCCADEAALCWACDEKVHAANKLASKHQRVPICTSQSYMPKCDICQETVGYFFCLEDRALLCRKCDVAIHTANAYVSAHQRFLLIGVKVGLEPTEPGPSPSAGKPPSGTKISEMVSGSVPTKIAPIPLAGECNGVSPVKVDGLGELGTIRMPPSGGSTNGSFSTIPHWHLDDFLGLTEFGQNYGHMDNGSSKADSGKLGDSDCSSVLRSSEEREADECLGQVPEICGSVPQVPSPPTTSGPYWPKNSHFTSDAAVSVPDICFSPLQNRQHCHMNGSNFKRQRRCQ
ncbi:B-box-type zinc finger [Dillenia turbinata]|uniref:B-box-type zinc finger n=1 Tax=Dillenia turbinata TaxID=194707 RepID=A0AAN8W5Y1_9MAGN